MEGQSMKNKHVLITFVDNGNFQSIISKEAMFNKVMKEFKDDGRVVSNEFITKSYKYVDFEDGSTIKLMPFGVIRGAKYTDIYVDKASLLLPNGEQLFYEIVDFNRDKESFKDRIKLFSQGTEEDLKIEEYNK